MAYPSTKMTPAEIGAFLTDTRHAVIATNCIDGPPQLSPVWYLYRDGIFYAGIDSGSSKYGNLRRDPGVSLCVDGAYPDARYVVVYGSAEFVEEPSAWRDEIIRAISMRYHESEEEAERSLRESSGPDTVLLVIKPYRMLGMNYN